jgi:hypothetical protein
MGEPRATHVLKHRFRYAATLADHERNRHGTGIAGKLAPDPLGQLLAQAERWLPLPRSYVERRVLKQTVAVIGGLNKLDRFAWAVPRLEQSWETFVELRDILRLSDAELPRGDRRSLSNREFPALEADRLREIEKTTAAYHDEIRQRVSESGRKTQPVPHTGSDHPRLPGSLP